MDRQQDIGAASSELFNIESVTLYTGEWYSAVAIVAWHMHDIIQQHIFRG